MKRIGIVLFLLAAFVIFKFSLENLDDRSLFFKVGVLNESKEYAVFVETGCKKKTREVVYQHISTLPPVKESIPRAAIHPVILSEEKGDEEFAHAALEVDVKFASLPKLPETGILTDAKIEEIGEFDFANLQFPEFIFEEAPRAYFAEYAAVDFDEHVVGSHFDEESCQFTSLAIVFVEPESWKEYASEPIAFDPIGFANIPNTLKEYKAALYDVEAKAIRSLFIADVEEIEEQFMAFVDSEIKDRIDLYEEILLKDLSHEIADFAEIEGFEVSGDILDTRREYAAAIYNAEQKTIRIIELPEIEAADHKFMVFGNSEILEQIEPFAELILPLEEHVILKDAEVEEFAASAALELPIPGYAAFSEISEKPAALVLFEDPLFTGMEFGSQVLAETLPLYEEILKSEQFTAIEVGSIPEFAATHPIEVPAPGYADVCLPEKPVQLGALEDPKTAETASGIEAPAPGYADVSLPEKPVQFGPLEEPKTVETASAVEAPEPGYADVPLPERPVQFAALEEPKTAETASGIEAPEPGYADMPLPERPVQFAVLEEPKTVETASAVEAPAPGYADVPLPERPVQFAALEESKTVETASAVEAPASGYGDVSLPVKPVAFAPVEEPKNVAIEFSNPGLSETPAPFEELKRSERIAIDVEPGNIPEFAAAASTEPPEPGYPSGISEPAKKGLEFTAIEEPKEKGIEFGSSKLAEAILPYEEAKKPEAAVVSVETGDVPEVASSTSVEPPAAGYAADTANLPEKAKFSPFKEPNLTELDFGDAKISVVIEPLAELKEEGRTAVAIKVDIPIFEKGKYEEVPDTGKEYAASMKEIREQEKAVEWALFEDPKLSQVPFGDAKLAEKAPPYRQFKISEAKETVQEALSIPDFERSEYVQEPDTSREYYAAERETRLNEQRIELAVFEEPRKREFPFGESVITDSVETYPKFVAKEAKKEDTEIKIPEFESEVCKDMPNDQVDFASIDKEVKEKEESIEREVQGKQAVSAEPVEEKEAMIRLADESAISRWFQRKPPEAEPPAAEKKRKTTFYPKRIGVRHVWGDQGNHCIPFATNFTTFEMFTASDYQPGHMYPFIDLRGHRFDNNTYAANFGVGGRYVPDKDSGFCEMLGFNGYYDYRQGCIGYFNQVGLGIEVLGRRWDFRGNAYAPFGRRIHINSCLFNQYEGDYYAIRRDIESISYSFSGEVGYLIVNGHYFALYAAAGPYFFARGKCSDGTPGIEARIRPQYRDYVALDLSARYDDVFGAIWQMEFIFTLPLYQISKQNKRPCGLRDWQIYQPVQRFEVMPLQKRQCWETNW